MRFTRVASGRGASVRVQAHNYFLHISSHSFVHLSQRRLDDRCIFLDMFFISMVDIMRIRFVTDAILA